MRADARDLLLTSAAAPGGIPAAAPGGIPAAAPGGIPAAAPGGIPAAAPGGIPAAAWGAPAAGSVRELEVTATRTGDLRLEHWQTVHAWLGMLSDTLRTPAEEQEGTLAELLANMPETIEGFKVNPFLPRGSDAGERFEALFKGQGAAAEMPPAAAAAAVLAWPVERIHAASALVDELRVCLERRIAEASRPRDTLSRRAAGLRESLGRLPEVSVLLQTGRDRAAMEIVIGFTDDAQSVLDLLPFLPPDLGRGKLIAEITPFLRDLVSAFSSKDSVLIGDLLEYEIMPRMERLTPLLEGAR
jgi:hypothetical protein